MIDWFSLAANTLWIFALAILLALVSYASWQASRNHEKISVQLRKPTYQVYIDLAAVMFCLGMAGTSPRAWETILWVGLAVLFIIQAVVAKFVRKT